MSKKRKDGYIQKTFTVNGKRYSVYGKTAKEAKEKELIKRRDIENKIYQRSKGLTVDAYFERWMESRPGTVSANTIKANKGMYSTISSMPIDKAGTKFGKLKLIEVERQNIIDLQAALKTAVKKDGKPYSTRTINDMISFTGQLLTSAKLDGVIPNNPAEGVKSLKRTEPKARDTIHRALTEEETKAFFEAAKGDWYYPLFYFMLSTGCRVGEAGALKLSCIRDDKLYIKVSITRDEINSYVVGDSTKTEAGERTIPITKDIKEALDAQKALNRIWFGNVVDIDKPIFRAVEGGILRESKVNDHISAICKASGIERFTSHAFRDTFATRALENDMKPKTLQDILGHADFGTTMNIYAHVMETTKEAEMQQVKLGI